MRAHVRGHEVGPHQDVVIHEDHDLADRLADPHVARLPGTEAEVFLPRVDEGQAALESARHRFGLVARAVVADDHPRERVAFLVGEALEERAEALGAPVGRDDEGRLHRAGASLEPRLAVREGAIWLDGRTPPSCRPQRDRAFFTKA